MIRMDKSTKGVRWIIVKIVLLFVTYMSVFRANNEDQDEAPHSVASDLGPAVFEGPIHGTLGINGLTGLVNIQTMPDFCYVLALVDNYIYVIISVLSDKEQQFCYHNRLPDRKKNRKEK